MYRMYHVLKKMVRTVMLALPNGHKLYKKISQLKQKVMNNERSGEALISKNLTAKDLFTQYYEKNFWGNPESVSGGGSTIEYTENLRREIPRLAREYNIKIFLDAPCGDYNWFQYVEKPVGMKYIGGDIVDQLVVQNQSQYSDEYTTFISLDIINERLPSADIWMCRDCLFHFSNADILKTLKNFVSSDIKYLFTSVHTNCTENTDILTGDVRLLNLELPPFNLPKPLLYVDDWIPNFHVRKMGLWTRSMIAEALKELY